MYKYLISNCVSPIYSWLLHDPHMEPRSMYQPFIEATELFFKRLLPILAPLQVCITEPKIQMYNYDL